MPTYIALLRGINVSGQKKIKMADLRSHLSELEISSITTYIQSGNIVFKSTISKKAVLAQQISDKILEKYGFKVPVLIKTPTKLKDYLSNFPFEFNDAESKGVYFTMLHQIPDDENIEQLQSLVEKYDLYALKRDIVYLFCPNGYGRTKLSNNFFEQKLKVRATTRNLRTMHKLIEMADNL